MLALYLIMRVLLLHFMKERCVHVARLGRSLFKDYEAVMGLNADWFTIALWKSGLLPLDVFAKRVN